MIISYVYYYYTITVLIQYTMYKIKKILLQYFPVK